MYAANLQQVYSNNPSGKPFKSWVINVSRSSKSEKENYLRDQHREIDITLSSQNVNYSEITTTSGKHNIYEKFGIQNKNHPIFLITNKYPENCSKKDKLLIVEWGNWEDTEKFREDVMALAYIFNNDDFIELISNAYDKKSWDKVIAYIKDNGLSLISIGVSIITALI